MIAQSVSVLLKLCKISKFYPRVGIMKLRYVISRIHQHVVSVPPPWQAATRRNDPPSANKISARRTDCQTDGLPECLSKKDQITVHRCLKAAPASVTLGQLWGSDGGMSPGLNTVCHFLCLETKAHALAFRNFLWTRCLRMSGCAPGFNLN